MKKEKKEKKLYEELGYDWHKLELYEIANEFLSQGKQGIPLAKKSLEMILKDKDISGSDPISITFKDPRVMELAIKNGLKIYQEAYSEQTLGDLVKSNEDALKSYAGENAEKIKKELEPFYGKKMKDIMKEMEKAEHIIKGEELGLNSEEQAKSAKEEYNKYAKIYTAINLLEEKRKSGLRRKVEDAYHKDAFNDLFAEEEEKAESKKSHRMAD